MTTAIREDVTKLLSVEMDRRRSTPFDEVWHAHSDRYTDVVYRVTHHAEDGTWACQCPGWFASDPDPAKRHCKHCTRCQRRRAVEWHHALRLGWGPQELRADRDRLLARAAEGWALHEDELCALDTLTLLIGEQEREAAA